MDEQVSSYEKSQKTQRERYQATYQATKSAKVKLTDKLIAVRKNYKEAHCYKEYFINIKKYVN